MFKSLTTVSELQDHRINHLFSQDMEDSKIDSIEELEHETVAKEGIEVESNARKSIEGNIPGSIGVTPEAKRRKLDSKIVTKLFECPICLKKLMNLPDAQEHVEELHFVDKANQERLAKLGVKIKEIVIA